MDVPVASTREAAMTVPPPTTGQTAFCHACGAPIDPRAEICPRCGVRQRPVALGRNRVVAALLGIFLGALGVHKFYLGRIGWGITYLLLCWTFIPAIVGFIEGIIYLTMSDEGFAAKYGA
jgi:TM2 domain-containing membrane protein YozV